jgi:DNA-binding MarR family transcriptional regulator
MTKHIISVLIMSWHSDYIERSFRFVLNDAARLMGKRFDQRCREIGLSRAQVKALAYILRNEGINQAALAELLEIEPISLARLVDRMEAAGWVERQADPNDRRARRLFVTEKSRPVFDQVAVVANDIWDEALNGLAAGDRNRLFDLLRHVHGNLSNRVQPAAGAATIEMDLVAAEEHV